MLNTRNIRSEPFLWIHLLGIGVLPLFLAITFLGLGIGNSYSFSLELPLLASLSILPILLMQLARPFNIFSILFLSLKPECLSDRQKTILSLFKTFKHQLYSTIAAILMTVLLWLLYRLSPLAIGLVDFIPQQRILGLGIASSGFLASNLFLQIPLTALLVLRAKPTKLIQTTPYPENQINHDFVTPGLQISNILWFIKIESEAESSLDSLDAIESH